MNKIIQKLIIVVLIVVPLVYGLMPDTNLDHTDNTLVSKTQPSNSEASEHANAENYPHDKTTSSASDNTIFPQELYGMQLTGAQSGEEAMQGVTRLHGLSIELKNAYIAAYEGNGKSAMIWISESKTEEEAKKLFKVMDEKMPKSKTFTEYHAFNLKGQEYRYVYWPDRTMHNYYYVIGLKNYWVAVSAEDPMPFLAEVMKKF